MAAETLLAMECKAPGTFLKLSLIMYFFTSVAGLYIKDGWSSKCV